MHKVLGTLQQNIFIPIAKEYEDSKDKLEGIHYKSHLTGMWFWQIILQIIHDATYFLRQKRSY